MVFYNFEINLRMRFGVSNFKDTEAVCDFFLHDFGKVSIGSERTSNPRVKLNAL